MCVLHVSSKNKSFSSFLEKTQFPHYMTHEKAEQYTHRQASHVDYGFSSVVSDADFDYLPEQIQDAIEYLTKYQSVLRELITNHEISDIVLDFPYTCRLLSKNTITQSDSLPADLLKLAGYLGIRIEMSLYPPSLDE